MAEGTSYYCMDELSVNQRKYTEDHINDLSDDEKYGYIYITENLINHHRYVGKNAQNFFNTKYMGSGVYFTRALNKYGLENFSCNIVEWCKSREELNKREIYWIAYYDAVKSKYFYNIAAGGDGGDTLSGLSEIDKKIHSDKCKDNTTNLWKTEEYRDKVINGMRSYWSKEENHEKCRQRALITQNTEESLKRKSEWMSQYNKNRTGKFKHREETKKRISENTSGEKNGMWCQPSPCKRKVMCIETGKVYESITEAHRDTGFDRSGLSHVAKSYEDGKPKSIHGTHWRYLDNKVVRKNVRK